MRYRKGLIGIAGLSCVCALAAPLGVALAQTPTTGAAPATSGTLQEVVITAERRAENIQTTPIAVTAVSGAQLRALQLNTVMDLQKNIPNFQVLTAGPYQSINIRGIGNTAITPSIVPGVAVTHDGLLSPETIFISEPFYDIHDVEVLRGPQGTLVGASSTGGAVEITSQDPNFRGVNGYVEGLLGNYTDQKVDGAVNLPISSTLAARIAFNWEQRHSFYKNDVFNVGPSHTIGDPGQVDDHNARLGLLWKPTANFQALFKASLNYGNTAGNAAEPNQYTFRSGPGEPCPDGSPGPVCHSLYYAYSSHRPFIMYNNLPAQNQATTVNRYSLALNYTLPDGIELRSLSGFQHLDKVAFQNDCYCGVAAVQHTKDVGPNDNYYSQEFDFLSPNKGKLTWIAGLWGFYRDTDVTDVTWSAFPTYSPSVPDTSGNLYPVGPLGTEIFNLAVDAVQRSYAVFGNVNWQFTKTLQLQAGLRGNWDYNFSTEPSNWYPGAPPNTGIVIQLPVTTGRPCPGAAGYSCLFLTNNAYQHNAVPTGKIDLNWTPLPGQFFYAFWARGYKSGGVIVGTPNGFKPEKVDDYELGWKSTDLGGRLQTRLGGYWMSYHDMQLPTLNPANGRTAVTNIPAASTIRGIEASAQGRFGGFGTDLTLTVDDSKIGAVSEVASFRLPPSAANLAQCTAGEAPPLCFNYTPFIVNLNGEQNPYTPKFTASLTLDYAFAIGQGALTPRVTYAYTGPQFDSIFQTDNYYLMTARHLLNTSLTYEAGPWTVQAFCNNCANEVYVAGAGGTARGDVWFYGAPRQFGLRVDRTF